MAASVVAAEKKESKAGRADWDLGASAPHTVLRPVGDHTATRTGLSSYTFFVPPFTSIVGIADGAGRPVNLRFCAPDRARPMQVVPERCSAAVLRTSRGEAVLLCPSPAQAFDIPATVQNCKDCYLNWFCAAPLPLKMHYLAGILSVDFGAPQQTLPSVTLAVSPPCPTHREGDGPRASCTVNFCQGY